MYKMELIRKVMFINLARIKNSSRISFFISIRHQKHINQICNNQMTVVIEVTELSSNQLRFN